MKKDNFRGLYFLDELGVGFDGECVSLRVMMKKIQLAILVDEEECFSGLFVGDEGNRSNGKGASK